MRTEVTTPREGTKHLGFHSTYCLSTSNASHMHDYNYKIRIIAVSVLKYGKDGGSASTRTKNA